MKKIYSLLEPTKIPDEFQKDFANLPENLLIFPSWLPRFQQLTEKNPKNLESVIDYPLGNGTLAKKAFESAEAFEKGGQELLVVLTAHFLRAGKGNFDPLAEELDLLQNLSLGRGDINLLIDLSTFKEAEKLDLTDWLKTQTLKKFTLRFKDDEIVENDLAIFHFALGNELRLRLFLNQEAQIPQEWLEKYGIEALYLPYLKNSVAE